MGAMINLQDFPVGYRFHPTGEEFVNHYLKRRVLGTQGGPCIIPDVDIYQYDPGQLPDLFHDKSIIGRDDQVQEWWFFSLDTPQRFQRPTRVQRSTPSGYWKKTGDDKEVKARGTATLNRTHVLCHLKHERDEKADNSTVVSERGAINLRDFELDLHRPVDEDLFPEPLIQAQMISLMELIPPENRIEFAAGFLQQLHPELGLQNNSFPSNLHEPANIEGPSVMDIPRDDGLTDESIQSMFGTSEEDEDIGDMQSADLAYAEFLEGSMQTEYDQTFYSHREHPVQMNRRAQTTDSVHGFVSLEEKKGVVEKKFNGSTVTSEKPKLHPVPGVPHRPVAPPIRPASEKSYSETEELRFRKVKQETAAKNVKPELLSLDETAARAKVRKYKERSPDRNSTRKTNSKENENAREKSNLVAASTVTTGEGTKSSTNSPLSYLVNVLVAIFMLLTITRLVLNF